MTTTQVSVVGRLGSTPNQERIVTVKPGWLMLAVGLLLLLGSIACFTLSAVAESRGEPSAALRGVSFLGVALSALLIPGFFTLQPNEARVLVLFGRYVGTVRQSGLHWGNPLYANKGRRDAVSSRYRISLRARNLISDKLKVNDKGGNPIEIAAVIVWRVHDTAQAAFDVDDYEKYTRIQSESALRHLANKYAYDHGEENEVTLRAGTDEVSEALRQELQDRLGKAGVTVDEARLTHLAYAPEIAQAMLRRQQAEAVIAARQKIVHGAVSMVDMALKELAEKHVVTLDEERRAAMVSNLMVVLCGEAEVHPVINTGTLYN